MQVLKLNVFHFSSVCTHNTENLTSRVEKTVYCKYPHTNTSVLSNEKKKPPTTDSNKTQSGMTERVMGRGMN